ncbi:MAG: hypothetical protein LBI68_01515 [Azoarcus sp.]|nr:hypothetical protein [Azoarcus sp.]
MRRIEFLFLFLLTVLAALPAMAQVGHGGVTRVFSCEVGGRPVFGDTLPKECYGRAWVEKVNGVTVYREAAQPTPAESASRREKERQRELAGREASRQKQQDDALRERYRSLANLDARRDYEVAQLNNAIAILRTDEQELTARRNRLDTDAAASKEGALPDGLAQAIAYADEELARARAAVEKKIKERDALLQRFEAERRRYIEITSAPAPSQSAD